MCSWWTMVFSNANTQVHRGIWEYMSTSVDSQSWKVEFWNDSGSAVDVCPGRANGIML